MGKYTFLSHGSCFGGVKRCPGGLVSEALKCRDSVMDPVVLGGSSQDLETWLITMVSKSLEYGSVSLPNGLSRSYIIIT